MNGVGSKLRALDTEARKGWPCPQRASFGWTDQHVT